MSQELQVISDFYDLTLELSRRIEKFPRQHRYTLGAEVERRLQTILGSLIRAKYEGRSEAKREYLRSVNLELEILRFQLRLAKDVAALPVKGHGHVAGLVENVGAQVGGWLRAARAK